MKNQKRARRFSKRAAGPTLTVESGGERGLPIDAAAQFFIIRGTKGVAWRVAVSAVFDAKSFRARKPIK